MGRAKVFARLLLMRHYVFWDVGADGLPAAPVAMLGHMWIVPSVPARI